MKQLIFPTLFISFSFCCIITGCATVRNSAIELDKSTRLTPEDIAEVDAWMARQPASYMAYSDGKDGYVITPHYASYRKAHQVNFLYDAVDILKARDYPVIYK